ncbi:MAG: MFS transporter [Myxococcota bacterium]
MAESGRASRLAILGSMYLAQGIVYGFGGFILLPTLAAGGVSLEAQAGILALAGLPWVLKLLWAPLLDRFGGIASGRARAFAAVAMLGMAAALVGLASPDDLIAVPQTVAWLWLLLNVSLSLQDVCTDALVLDLVPASERGMANGVLLGGHRVGSEGIGGVALGMLVASQGLSVALWGQALLMLVLAGLPLLLKRPESVVSASQRAEQAGLKAALAELLRSRSTVTVALVAAIAFSAEVLTSTVSATFWIQRLQWSVEDLSGVLAPLVLVSNLVAFGLAALTVDRYGHRRSAVAGSILLGCLWAGFGVVPGLWDARGFMMAFVAIQALPTAMLYVGLHALFMDATNPTLRASHFAVLMALLNLPRVVVAPMAPGLLESLDYEGLWIASGVFQVVVALAIARAPIAATQR